MRPQHARQRTRRNGADTSLQSSLLHADALGANLVIASLQDSSNYAESQSSSGFAVSVPIGAGKGSGSVSASKTDIASNYRSANVQSGIAAAEGGFQVNVAGNTDLKGGKMTSSDQAIADNKNSLTTGTLSSSDLSNQASASASSSGYSLGTDMVSEGKYGLSKAALTNAMDNASASSSSAGQTKSAVSTGSVTITDEAQQKQRTGKDAATTVASLNRDTVNANTTAQRQDVQAMRESVEAERAIKAQAVKELTTLNNEAYRAMFKETPKFYKVTCPAGADCTKNPELAQANLLMGTPEKVQTELAKADKGAVLAVNGIDNPLGRAAQLAMQNAELVRDANGVESKPNTIYLMHYAPANNGLSELLVAAYEKDFASTLGYSNQDLAYAAAIAIREQKETVSQGHSRGAIVQTNANTILGDQGFTNPKLEVRAVGGGTSVEAFNKAANKVRGSTADAEKVTFSYFKDDPVPIAAGGNPGVMSLSEFWQVLTTSNSAHSCYGTGAAGCRQVQILSPNAPAGAVQSNSNLIRFKGGIPYDSNDQPLQFNK